MSWMEGKDVNGMFRNRRPVAQVHNIFDHMHGRWVELTQKRHWQSMTDAEETVFFAMHNRRSAVLGEDA